MIPKIIHYCWISGDPFPEKIQMCYDSWKRILPDYEIVLWDYAKVHSLHSCWCEKAMECKKYAFVADYVRFFALFHYGGIYLDSDVEVLKPFDDLLHLGYFVGKEHSEDGLNWEAAIIGSEIHQQWIKVCLNYYRFRPFCDKFGTMRTLPLPRIMRERLEKYYHIVECNELSDWNGNKNEICRFPYDWFSPKSWQTFEVMPTANTYTIHHFSASWVGIESIAPHLSLCQRVLSKIRPYVVNIKTKLKLYKQ